jgi:hypothetical protein
MTDCPRFVAFQSLSDQAHHHYHGAPLVELVFRLTGAWQCLPRTGHRLARLLAVAVAFTAFATSAWAQETVRIRGSIERIEGSTYIVKARAGDVLRLSLAPNAGVAASMKAQIRDIAEGAYIGIAALPQPDGSLRALEVHIFHESMRGTAEGHRPWDLLPQSTMTNATVESVVSAVDGHVVTLKYKDGEQRISIQPGTTVVTYLPGSVSELRPGAAIFVPAATRLADGTLLAQRIMVGRDIAPPQ